jgi:hypothetical protein
VIAVAGTIYERFAAEEIEVLRKRVTAVRRGLSKEPAGWFLSPIDPVRVLKIFSSLRLRDGFVLRAYVRRDGDGEGIVWAVPEGTTLPDPSRRPKLFRWLLPLPKPSAALGNVMGAIEGDGNPFSYLCASILSRELAEFGATWHNVDWGHEQILDKDPWIDPPPTDEFFGGFHPNDPWRLEAPRPEPDGWAPRVQLDKEAATVTFITFSGLIKQEIKQITDRFSVGSYAFKTETTRLATGPDGFRV